MDIMTVILFCVVSFVVAGLIFGFIAFKMGVNYRKKVAEAEIGCAEEQAKKILIDAAKDADTKKKEAIIEAKEESHKLRTDADREIKERRVDLIKTRATYSPKRRSIR